MFLAEHRANFQNSVRSDMSDFPHATPPEFKGIEYILVL